MLDYIGKDEPVIRLSLLLGFKIIGMGRCKIITSSTNQTKTNFLSPELIWVWKMVEYVKK